MKKKKGYIALIAKVDGKEERIEVSADELKQAIKKLKIWNNMQKNIKLQFATENDEILTVPMQMSLIQTLIKTA